jgi:hypothetical protein
MCAGYIFIFFLQFLLAKIVTPHIVNFAWDIQVKSISFAWHIQVKKFGAEIEISCTMHPDFGTKSQVCVCALFLY